MVKNLIAPSIKFSPFKKFRNFTIQSAFSIPLINKENIGNVYLDQKGYTWQNKFFYDYISNNETIQLFTEFNTEYNFGENNQSFANDSLRVSPGVFISYFPNQNFTVLGLVQHSNLIAINNNFSQNYTVIGFGTKYQVTRTTNVEIIYTKFVRGRSSGLGQTFNVGIRTLLD